MADRKAMYVPAPSVFREVEVKRKSLAQGIPITDESLDEEFQLRSLTKDVISTSSSGRAGSPFTYIHKENDSQGTPRKLFPSAHTSREEAPSAEPAHELSVSDSDDEIRSRGSNTRFSHQLPEVTVIDATGPKLSANVSEVVVKESVQFSPAKVVCHSPPSHGKKKTTKQGIPDFVRIHTNKMNESAVRTRKELVYDSSSSRVEGSPVDRSSAAYPVHTEELSSSEELSVLQKQEDETMNMSKLTESNDTIKSDGQPAKDRKGKKGRVVKSRYMTSAARKEKGDRTKVQEYLNSTKDAKNSSGSQKSNKLSAQTKTKAESSLLQNISAIGPQPTKLAVKGLQTSTPFWTTTTDRTAKGMMPDGSFMELVKGQKNDSGHKAPSTRGKKQGSSFQEGTQGAVTENESLPNQISESLTAVSDFELRFARTLQASYLKEKMVNAFEQQQRDAINQLYAGWQENERKKEEINAIKQAYEVKKYTLGLDQILNTQANGLALSEGVLKQFERDFGELARAVENAQLFMPLKGITVSSSDHLLMAFEESTTLLDEINKLTEEKAAQLEQLAQEFEQLNETTKAELEEQKGCSELLKVSLSLSRQEQSLQAGIIERDYKSYWDV